jgi:hypothetical protein
MATVRRDVSTSLGGYFSQYKSGKNAPAASAMYPPVYPLQTQKHEYPTKSSTYSIGSNVCVPPSTDP